jgi:hypothetical protein
VLINQAGSPCCGVKQATGIQTCASAFRTYTTKMTKKTTNRIPNCFRLLKGFRSAGSLPLATPTTREDFAKKDVAAFPISRDPSTIRTSIGTWQLGKTIGATSSGKVKLGTNIATGYLVRDKNNTNM